VPARVGGWLPVGEFGAGALDEDPDEQADAVRITAINTGQRCSFVNVMSTKDQV